MLVESLRSEFDGEGGIRTLVGAKLPIRFRVGAVMTASVPLQVRELYCVLSEMLVGIAKFSAGPRCLA